MTYAFRKALFVAAKPKQTGINCLKPFPTFISSWYSRSEKGKSDGEQGLKEAQKKIFHKTVFHFKLGTGN